MYDCIGGMEGNVEITFCYLRAGCLVESGGGEKFLDKNFCRCIDNMEKNDRMNI